MMRKFISLVLVFFSVFSFAAEYDFDSILDEESSTKEESEIKVNKFLNKAKNEQKKVSQIKWKEEQHRLEQIRRNRVENSSSSSSYGRSSTGTSSSSATTTKRSQPGYVTGIEKDGDVTVVKCSIGKDTRIYNKYGKCSDDYNFGSYSCESVMQWAKDRCKKRK